ncbi:MAG TPA: helix-turn-helix domain-containing protein [Prevotella sp.]
MKPIYSVLVFMALITSSFVAGMSSYRSTETSIVADMNNALRQTLAEKHDLWITPDTIESYRSHLSIARLRDQSIVSYDVNHAGSALCSDRMTLTNRHRTLHFRSYANCSFLTVLGMSDQRLSAILALLAGLWLFFSLRRVRRTEAHLLTLGSLSYAVDEQQFYANGHNPLKLTPMQHRLMQMFITAEHHKLSKQCICEALWPKKEDASETLYTLIRRLKPIIEHNSNVRIEVERGRSYRLNVGK